MPGEDFKASEQPWNISHLACTRTAFEGPSKGCAGGVPERGECQEPDFLQLYLKLEPSARPIFQPPGQGQVTCVFSDLFKAPLKCLCGSQF